MIELTDEVELYKALAEFKDALESPVLSVCCPLQREEVYEQV